MPAPITRAGPAKVACSDPIRGWGIAPFTSSQVRHRRCETAFVVNESLSPDISRTENRQLRTAYCGVCSRSVRLARGIRRRHQICRLRSAPRRFEDAGWRFDARQRMIKISLRFRSLDGQGRPRSGALRRIEKRLHGSHAPSVVCATPRRKLHSGLFKMPLLRCLSERVS
jgi:hypothetical protein